MVFRGILMLALLRVATSADTVRVCALHIVVDTLRDTQTRRRISIR
jgi:hypothetical protein